MQMDAGGPALGLDFGTTNSVVALGTPGGTPELVTFAAPAETSPVFRSALCFWQDDSGKGLASDAGPWAIAEYMEYPLDSRFIQSFKSVAAMKTFEQASVFDKRYRFEEMGQLFLEKLIAHAGGKLDTRPHRIVVGRPVEYAGARPDEALARTRYNAMFKGFGAEIHYVYEPLGAAYSYATRLTEPATILVADFGGGTSDFSVVRVAEPGAARRGGVRRSGMRALGSRAIGSITGSSTGWCCRCWARAARTSRSARNWKFRARISPISRTGRASR